MKTKKVKNGQPQLSSEKINILKSWNANEIFLRNSPAGLTLDSAWFILSGLANQR